MKLAPLASVAIIVGLVGYIIGGTAPSTPAQSGWSGVPTADQLMGRAPAPLAVSHPRDWVRLEHGVIYTVPVGKYLVMTALGGCTHRGDTTNVSVKSGGSWKVVVEATQSHTVGAGASMQKLPTGITFAPGEELQVWGVGSVVTARGWGYLVDA